jgi:peptide/nickel transport system substrate-binding protein
MRLWRRSWALTAAAVLAVSACSQSAGSSGSSGGQPVSGGTLTLAIPTDPGNLDPQQTSLVIDNEIWPFAYDPLVNEAPSGAIVSGLATSWRQSGNSATFTLNKQATCADGSRVTPSLVAANIAYIANPKNHSPLAGTNLPAGVTAHADSAAGTVTMSWPKPYPFFFQQLAGVPIICPKGLANRSVLAHGTDGSGPYVLSQAVPNAQYTYTLRKHYAWGPGAATAAAKGQPAKVVLKLVANETTAANLLISGSVNIAGVTGPDRSRLAAQHLFSREFLADIGEMEFNETPGKPGSDETVRRALTMALNLPQIRSVIASGNGVTPTGLETITPRPCHGNTVAGNVPSFSLSAAQRLLTADGWQPGPGGVRQKNGKPLALTFIYATSEGTPAADAAQLALSQWTKLGVKVHMQGLTDTQISSVIFGTGNWDIGWVALTTALPSQAAPFFSGPAPSAGTNYEHIVNPAYNKLTAQATVKPGSSGCPLWNQAEEALIRRVDVVPFAAQTQPTWAKNATFVIDGNGPIPTSLRLLAG